MVSATQIILYRRDAWNGHTKAILASGPGATVLLSDSTVLRNNVGISTVSSGQPIPYGNNRIDNNLGPEGVPTSSLTLN